jgi:hypothetical protein
MYTLRRSNAKKRIPAELRMSILATPRRHILSSLLLAAAAMPLAAQAALGSTEGCAGLPLFGQDDSLNKSDLRVASKDLLVRVSPKGPELHLRLEPDLKGKSSQTATGRPNAVQRVGWIRVFSCETGTLVQSLEVQSLWGGPEFFLRFFQVKDANFDGYLDVSVLKDGGATWGNQTWWVFSRAAGRFVSNDFTRALSLIDSNGLKLDKDHRNIVAYQYRYPQGCGTTKDIYHVEQSRLVLIHKEDADSTGDSCKLTTHDLVDGKMRLTKVEQLREFAH